MRDRWLGACLSGGLLLLAACTAQTVNLDAASDASKSEIRIRVDTSAEDVRISIDGETPLVYTAFRLPEPPRLIVDLAGVTFAADQQVLTVEHGAVTTVTPIAAATAADVARIEIGLTELVDYEVRPDGMQLTVTIANPLIAAADRDDTRLSADIEPMESSERAMADSALVDEPSLGTTPSHEEPVAEGASLSDASSITDAESSVGDDSMSPAEAAETDAPEMIASEIEVADESQPFVADDGDELLDVAEIDTNVVNDSRDVKHDEPEAESQVGGPEVASHDKEVEVTESVAVDEQDELVPPALPLHDASVVSGIRVQQTGEPLQVTIQGDGLFHPQTMVLSGPRLVIDLPGTTAKLRTSTVTVDEPMLKRIRIGQHKNPLKVRVVFDLSAPGHYQVEQLGESLVVTFAQEQELFGDATTAQIGSVPATAPSAHPPKKVVAEVTPTPGKATIPTPTPTVSKQTVSAQLLEPEPAAPPAGDTVTKVREFTGQRISLDFQDADLDNVLRLMADVSGLNIVVGEGVKGKVTVKLINVPWDQALELILKTHGLGQVREGNILRIDTLANLSRQQDEEARAKESANKAEDLVTQVMYVNYAEAKDLVKVLEKNLSPRGDITIDTRTNALIVKDIRDRIDEVAALLRVLDLQTPQVLIEARIVSADTNFARDLGVQWGGDFRTTSGPFQLGAITGPTGDVGSPDTGFLVNLPASGQAGSLGSLGFTIGRLTSNPFSLDLRLSAGESMGVSKTISAPRIAVLDNQTAKIQQGTSIPFQTTSQQGTQTTFVDANLVLEVTPHVTPDGSILMDVRIANNEPDFANLTPAGPPIKKKEATTNILVKDGETAVIGGIYVSTKAETVSGVPWFYKIPVLGWLFKTETKSNNVQELLVFLTPRIMQ